ncbi:STAS domain-containing protein [Streptomyces sp. NPDC059690]|uniref:STAS domain-containing protein n=1 Tax=Streptomyces sp. NPDC059690 TaxID=3346907 RepID=UPI0036A88812
MTAEAHSSQPGVVSSTVDGRQAEVTLSGDIDISQLRGLEAELADPRLNQAEHWVLNLHGATHVDLACAYALLRAVTEHPGPTTVRGARHAVLRTLQQADLDKEATFEN